jgi:hypothetical protein
MRTCGQAVLAEGCANNAVLIHMNRVGARATPDLLMFGVPDYANEECMYFSSTAETRIVCTLPRLRKREMWALLLDYANEECMYFSSTTPTGNVCAFPRLRKRGMCVLCSITRTRNQKGFRTNSRTAGFRRPHLKWGRPVESFTGCPLKLRCSVR